jgi:hypothetical protein
MKKLKNFKDPRGNLFSFQNNNFIIKRVFFIKGLKNAIRGNHAHKTTKQIIININAKVKIKIHHKHKIDSFQLLNSGDYLNCMKQTWVKIKFLKSGYLAVICNKNYEKNDYVYDFKKFCKL